MSWIVKPSYVDPGGGCNGYCKTFCGARTCVNNCSKNFCLVNLLQLRLLPGDSLAAAVLLSSRTGGQ